MKSLLRNILIIAIALFTLVACEEDQIMKSRDLAGIAYDPQPYVVNVPENFPPLEIPEDNPMTQEGVELGRRLFYDPILSRDSTISCASCHFPELAFTDGVKFSVGIDGQLARRSSMSLVNIGFFYNGLFWDGRVQTLEEQSLHPIEDPLEQGFNLQALTERLRAHDDYPARFRKAFGIEDRSEINSTVIGKAIAQWERIIISGNSRFDQWQRGLISLEDEELVGRSLFFDLDDGFKDAECIHCHSGNLFTANTYHNNGLDSVGNDYSLFRDVGLGINGIVGDTGKFRATSLRNIELTGPYMHDGRIGTLEEVVEHYSTGIKPARNKDPLVSNLNLTEDEKFALVQFMKTLTDTSYLDIPEVLSPFE